MIIELFGPPAAGKTTFARNLAAHLRRSGRPVEVILSLRPAEAAEPTEGSPSAPPPLAALRRLARPAIELLAGLGHMGLGSHRSGIASQLFDLLPPASAASSVRLRQYLTRLETSWRRAELSDATVIFDQGFIQGICSLAQHSQAPAALVLEKAVALIPKADQWISIAAPPQLLRARLEARRNSQSWVERRFELDMQTSLRSIEILATLESILRRLGARVTRVGPGDGWPGRDFHMGKLRGVMTQDPWLGLRTR